MSDCIWLLRHGATEWTHSARHTGRRDIPLSDDGREQAASAGAVLAGRRFARVLVSPQSRALQTCRLAGHGDAAQTCDDLVEWDYGEYEGLTDEQTQERQPGWNLFRDGCPGGETPQEVVARVDRVLAAVGEIDGTCLLVGHGKLLRALAGRWLTDAIEFGDALSLEPAGVSVLERGENGPQLKLWNLTPGLAAG